MKYLLIFLMSLKLAGASVVDRFHESDLSFSSPSYTVTFLDYRQLTPDNLILSTQRYASAIITSNLPQIKNHHFKSFNSEGSSIFYYTFDNEENIDNLNTILTEASIDSLTCSFHPSTGTLNYKETSNLLALTKDLKEAETVCITFGSGISAGYVPTLIEIFNKLGLEKFRSEDGVTDESMENFIAHLINDKTQIMLDIRTLWEKVIEQKIETTPAHQGLAKLIKLLQKDNKSIYTYTDNIDGIHHKLDIKLSESMSSTESNTINILYPPSIDLKKKKVVVLVCGQSFDFHGVLSTIDTRGQNNKNLLLYALNLRPSSIDIYKGLDVEEEITGTNKFAFLSNFPLHTLQAKWIEGSLHDLLPQLTKLYE